MTVAEPDVLVVGAGPTGLVLAMQAHRHGASVRVVERRLHRLRPSRALIVHPRTLEVLRPLGVVEALLARGEVAPSVRLHLGRREVATTLGPFALEDTAFPHISFVPQAAVETVLSDALAASGVEVERGVEVIGLDRREGRVVAHLDRAGAREEAGCRYVAGCDRQSITVRRSAGLEWRGGPYRQEVVLADIELAGELAAGVGHAVAARDGVVFLFALGERATWRLIATRPLRPADRHHVDGQLGDRSVPSDEVRRMIDLSGLGARVADVAWSSAVSVQHRIASRYRQGAIFLVGDAAHCHSPAGGQGMNTGIQDAVNLGWKLGLAARADSRRCAAADFLLDSYESERRPVARVVLTATNFLFWAEASTDPVASFARGVLAPAFAPAVPLILGRPRLVAEGARVLCQLATSYRRSPVSIEDTAGCRRGARPGERLPDETVSCRGGS